jgi:hypothetical protein
VSVCEAAAATHESSRSLEPSCCRSCTAGTKHPNIRCGAAGVKLLNILLQVSQLLRVLQQAAGSKGITPQYASSCGAGTLCLQSCAAAATHVTRCAAAATHVTRCAAAATHVTRCAAACFVLPLDCYRRSLGERWAILILVKPAAVDWRHVRSGRPT